MHKSCGFDGQSPENNRCISLRVGPYCLLKILGQISSELTKEFISLKNSAK